MAKLTRRSGALALEFLGDTGDLSTEINLLDVVYLGPPQGATAARGRR